MCFFTDKNRLVSGCVDAEESVILWNVEKAEKLKSFSHDTNIRSMSLSPNEKFLATANYGEYPVKIWNLETGQ